MLICVKLKLIASQFSMILSSPIFLTISEGSSVANIAAGLENGMAAGGAPGAAAPGMNPGIAIPKGFHMRCMNSSACSGENGSDGASDTDVLLKARVTK